MIFQKFLKMAALPFCFLSGVAIASAADFPNRPVDLVVGFKAGGGVDTYARALGKVASHHLDGQPIVVVNQPGGGGMIAGRFVADQPATGYSVYLASAGSLVLRNLAKKQVVSPDDFKMVATIGDLTAGVFVPASSSIKSLEELVATLKKGDRTLRWGHTSRGNVWHIAGVGLLNANDVKAKDIPFKGGSGVRSALVADQIDFGVMGAHLARGFEDEIRLLAVLSDQKHPAVPDAKTAKELGVAFTKVTTPIIAMVPAGTDDKIVSKLSDAFVSMAKDEEYLASMTKAGLPPVGVGSKETAAFISNAKTEWAPLVEAK